MLFATLDPTLRQVLLPGGVKAMLSDTVGFISDLPTQLVAAFRATLEEVLEADLILHVRDIAHPEAAAQAADVEAILTELGVGSDVPRIEVWNKADLLPPDHPDLVVATRRPEVRLVSALTGTGLPALIEAVAQHLDGARRHEVVVLPHAAGRARAWLHAEGLVEDERTDDDGFHLRVHWSPRHRLRLSELLEPDPTLAPDA
jgi:GTP-binding protein HflX